MEKIEIDRKIHEIIKEGGSVLPEEIEKGMKKEFKVVEADTKRGFIRLEEEGIIELTSPFDDAEYKLTGKRMH